MIGDDRHARLGPALEGNRSEAQETSEEAEMAEFYDRFGEGRLLG